MAGDSVRRCLLSLLVLMVTSAVRAEEDAPKWPITIKPVWPTRYVSFNYTGNFPKGPAPYENVTLVGTWYYDWSTNMWRQDTCVRMSTASPPSCKIELWKGNDHTAGQESVGTTYVWNQEDGSCSYAASMVPSITHPDSFATGIYKSRIRLGENWGDMYIQDTSSWIGYNFSTTMDVRTQHPLRDCGPTSPSPPYAYACSNHHDVHVAEEFSETVWSSFFELDTSKCKPSTWRISHGFNPIRSHGFERGGL